MNEFDISRLQALGIAPRPQVEDRSELGQEDFLRLMLAQLENQDPTSPLESNEFLAQITQFSVAEGITNLQSSFADLASSLTSNQALQASTLVGRSVVVPGSEAFLNPEGGLEGVVSVPSSNNGVTVDILDQSGQRVHSLNLGPQVAGNVNFAWDGVNSNGQRLAAGTYRVEARSIENGVETSLSTSVVARVESVTLQGRGGSLEINLAGLGSTSFGSVQEIR